MKGKILECQMECLLMAKVPVSITPHLFLMVLTMKLLKSIQRLSGASLLILANKQDLKGALTPNEIAKVLNLENMDKTRHWKIVGCSAYTGKGLLEEFDWLVQDMMIP
ncbi:ADP-ribosylation factor-like protein 2 [Manihot esculenta]|uniref:ADP-ribosylation factor-like protein 2 n=1 Tax=Manihot esculenta TaxID=3983 RepID=UPI001CC3DEC3|nr:ADP-ribosylation factor-like protein 2 [Manihot esculenta]